MTASTISPGATITRQGIYWLVSAGAQPLMTFTTLQAALKFIA